MGVRFVASDPTMFGGPFIRATVSKFDGIKVLTLLAACRDTFDEAGPRPEPMVTPFLVDSTHGPMRNLAGRHRL